MLCNVYDYCSIKHEYSDISITYCWKCSWVYWLHLHIFQLGLQNAETYWLGLNKRYACQTDVKFYFSLCLISCFLTPKIQESKFSSHHTRRNERINNMARNRSKSIIITCRHPSLSLRPQAYLLPSLIVLSLERNRQLCIYLSIPIKSHPIRTITKQLQSSIDNTIPHMIC